MRKLIATIFASLALAGVGLATHTTTSDSPAAMIITDNSYRFTSPDAGFYWMDLNG